jgi:hypothetical protein
MILPGAYAVWKQSPRSGIPSPQGQLWSVTVTPDEVSVVSSEDQVPPGVTAERGWRALVVEGPLALDQTGVLASLSKPLAGADIPIFVVSSYSTDYLLVREADLTRAVSALEDSGHQVDELG